ncbi:MAG: hypothetical protein WBD25_21820 [Terriglobales bacterium]
MRFAFGPYYLVHGIQTLQKRAYRMMLPHPLSLRGVVQHRPSHRSNYHIPLTKELSQASLFHLALRVITISIHSYLGKYLILWTLN